MLDLGPISRRVSYKLFAVFLIDPVDVVVFVVAFLDLVWIATMAGIIVFLYELASR